MKIRSILQLYEMLPEMELMIVDVLRSLVKDTLPDYCKEKISYNVPFFYGKKGICIIWPSTIPRGGIKDGVLLGFWYGNRLADSDNYLIHGTNKQIFYRIYTDVVQIDTNAINKLLHEAANLDQLW